MRIQIDPADHFDMDPDGDPDPTFQFDANPDPRHCLFESRFLLSLPPFAILLYPLFFIFFIQDLNRD
jgi:hypothetical protein